MFLFFNLSVLMQMGVILHFVREKATTLRMSKWNNLRKATTGRRNGGCCFLELSFFLLILARSNFDHYARECNFGILKKKQKQNKKTKQNKKNKKNLPAVFLTK